MNNWGLKSSNNGKDVFFLDGNNFNPDLSFSSKYKNLRIAKSGDGSFTTGSSSTVAHGLGYPSAYIIYTSTDNIKFSLYGYRSYIDSTNLVIEADNPSVVNTYKPIDDNDYGNESGAGYGNTYAKIGHDSGFGGDWNGALRFRNVNETSSVTSAELGFYIYSRTGGSVSVSTHGINEDNTSDFSGSPFGRSQTTAVINNNCDSGISSGGFWAFDVTNIFTEITGRPGWSSGNNMGFLLRNNGTTGNNYIIDDSRFLSENNSYLKITTTSAPQTIYYKYVIFTNKIDSTKSL